MERFYDLRQVHYLLGSMIISGTKPALIMNEDRVSGKEASSIR